MLIPSEPLPSPVAHDSTSKSAVPQSATQRCRRHTVRQLSSVLLVTVGLGLACASSVQAQDLPTAPVHVAAADGSAVASVDLSDLSDSTKFPFSSTGKWKGYLEFLGKPGTERSLGQPDLFLPLLQDKNDMTFFNLRGQLQFDNTDVHEYNIGLGHRHMFQEWILGGYGYFDRRHTQFGSSYNQFTGGVELMSVDWAFRMNGYLPENKTETMMGGANAQVIRPGDQIKVQIDGIVQEKALPGVDGEVGYLLPILWRAYTAVFDETRVYAGGYHFFGEDQFESVTGPRGRVEWRAYDLPVLGPGSRFMMGVEAQWDEPRGSQAFGLASLRIPFDVFSDKSKRTALTGLDRRMLQPIIRDVDVVTSEVDMPTEITDALNPAGNAYTKALDIQTEGKTDAEVASEIEALQELYPDELLVAFIDGDPNDLQDMGNGDFRHMVNTGALNLGEHHTLSSAGKELLVEYDSQRLGAGSVGYTPDGTPVGLTGSITMGSWSQVNGMLVDATGFENGIWIPSSNTGTYWLTNSTVMNSVSRGVLAEGSDNMLFIRDSYFTGNTTGSGSDSKAAIMAQSGAHIDADNLTIMDGYHGVVASGVESYIHITNSLVHDHVDEGIRAHNGGEIYAEDIRISNSTFVGALANGIGSKITLIDSSVFGTRTRNDGDYGYGDGILAEGGAILIAYNVDIYDNAGWAVNSWNPGSFLYISHSRIFNNGLDGLNVDEGEMVADHVTITGNGEEGADVMDSGILTITNSTISNNGSHGLYANNKYDSVGIIKASNVAVTGNGGYGALAAGGHITIDNSVVANNALGAYKNYTSGALLDPEVTCFSFTSGTITVNDESVNGVGAPLSSCP